MKQFFSFVLKEAKHIFRDKRTMLMLFGMPIMLMLLFGFAVTNDVRNVRTIIVVSSMDYATRQATNRLAASEYFTISAQVSTPSAAGAGGVSGLGVLSQDVPGDVQDVLQVIEGHVGVGASGLDVALDRLGDEFLLYGSSG